MVFGIWCPLGDCKKGGRLLAKAETEAAVRERLRAHLWNAPAHAGLSDDDREAFAMMAEVTEWADDSDEAAAAPPTPEGAPPFKRARTQPIGKASGKAQAMLAQQHQARQEQEQQQQLLEEQQQQLQMSQQRAEDLFTLTQAVAEGVSIAMGRGSAAGASSSTAVWAPPSNDMVQLPRTVVSAALDHLSRAEQAARQAHMIAAKAAVAFEAEAGAIATAKAMVEGLVRHLGR